MCACAELGIHSKTLKRKAADKGEEEEEEEEEAGETRTTFPPLHCFFMFSAVCHVQRQPPLPRLSKRQVPSVEQQSQV